MEPERFLSPAQRFTESMKLWEEWRALGGSLDPEPDPQSPFYDPDEWNGWTEIPVATIGSGIPVMCRVRIGESLTSPQ